MTTAEVLNIPIILVSKSPRRKELLQKMGFEVKVVSGSECEETYPSKLQGGDIPMYLANMKMKSFDDTSEHYNSVIVTADTIVWLNGKVYGKPKDRAEAIEMLKELSGKTHYVYTGVCLKYQSKQELFCAQTKVLFRQFEMDEIEYYVDSYSPFDKAGAYGIQEWIGYIGVEAIEGSYFNVMGLPVQMLYKTLLKMI